MTRDLCFEDETALPCHPEDLIWVPPNLSLEEVTDLAAGIVPRRLQATALQTLDFDDFCRRNAEKPVPRKARHAP